jgi:GTP-binding protein
MPQTRFVLRKAFAAGLRPIVVINKIDRPDARITDVLNGVFDLFVELDADDATLDFPTVYASGRSGIASLDPAKHPPKDLQPVYEVILSHVPPPDVDFEAPLQMLVVTLAYSDYVGRIAVGRIVAGKIRKGQRVALLKHDGRRIDDTVAQLYTFERLGRVEVNEASAGDICAVVGLEDVDIGDTIADFDNAVALPPITVDEPTLEMVFRINDSPFVGQDGQYVTSRQLRDRLMKELESNVALRVTPDEVKRDEFHVAGRGLLHLGILLENMRREGYELSVGKPRVLNKTVNGVLMEPIEYLVIEAPPAAVGAVMELVGNRRAECLKMDGRGELTHMEFTIPARGLIGLKTRLQTATSGEAIMHHNFFDYQAMRGSIPTRINGVMVSTETGRTTAYALDTLQERGIMFVGPGEQVYEGQIVAEHCRDNDLPVNVCREKKLTNIRAAGADKAILLRPPKQFTLETALEYIEDDELVEVTPKAIRLRKTFLRENDRKRFARQARAE